MKWLITVFALCLSMSAQAQEKLNFAIVADGGQSCAWFKGSFDRDGYMRPKDDSKPVVICELVENVGATCWLGQHGINGLPTPLKMTGFFREVSDGLVTEVDAGVVKMRVFCTPSKGCMRINIWDVNDYVGFSCDMHKFIPQKPKAPEPQAPPLLRKNTPEYKAPAQKPVEIGV